MMSTQYALLLKEVRDMARELRTSDREASFRKWSAKLRREAGFPISFRTIKREEEENDSVPLGYILACAIAADVEIVLGKEPRIIKNGVEGKATEFIRFLRRAPAVNPADIESVRAEIDRKLTKPSRVRVA